MAQEIELRKPSKFAQKTAMESYAALSTFLKEIGGSDEIVDIEIEVEETQQTVKVPYLALELLTKVLKELGQGRPVSVLPQALEMTTQAGADFLGCSRPHLVKLLEEGKIPFTKVGKHRRILLKDLIAFKKQKKEEQKKAIMELMKFDKND